MRGARGRRLLAAVVALAVAAGAVACSDDEGSGDGAEAPGAGVVPGEGVLRLAVPELGSFDPADAVPTDQAALVAVDLLFDGLVAPAAGEVSGSLAVAAGVEPALAESWSVDEAGEVWTFVLGEGRTFSDGSPVRAADVVFTLERLAQRGDESLAGTRLGAVVGYDDLVSGAASSLAGVRAVDERTVEIRTAEPFGALVEVLAAPSFGVVPEAAAGGDGFAQRPVGSGPFVVVAATAGAATLDRRTDAGGPGGGEVPTSSVPSIEVVAYGNPESAVGAVDAGEADWAVVPGGSLDGGSGDDGSGAGRRVVTPWHVELFVGFNLASPALADVRVREAVVRAIDRAALAEDLGGTLLDGPVVAGVWAAEAVVGEEGPCAGRCDHDVERAEALVAEALAGTDPATIFVDVYEGEAEEAMADAVVAALVAVGLPAEKRVRSLAEYEAFVVSGEADLFGFGWVGVAAGAEAYLGPLFGAASPDNLVGLDAPAVELGLLAARREAPGEATTQRYRDVERAVMAEMPIVPLVQLSSVVALSDRVEGYVQRVDGTVVLDGLTLG